MSTDDRTFWQSNEFHEPMKYFSIKTIKSALENLQPIDNKWFIIPLVLAANGVTENKKVDTKKSKGTGKFLKNFFDGQLIGLEPREHGKSCNIRPGNSDPRTENKKLIHVDYSDLWGKTYSQSGYGAWQDGDILLKPVNGERGYFQLGPGFSKEFRKRINSNFKFESLLVWSYAFKGFPSEIESWKSLLENFCIEYMQADVGIPTEYQDVFTLSEDESWPTDFINERPSDSEFLNEFLPELATVSITPGEILRLRDTLMELVNANFIGLSEKEAHDQANAVVSALMSCRRLFLYGEPGIGKTELAQLIGTTFQEVFDDRIHVVFAPIAESTTSDKLIGFSTLDGSWVHGILTQSSKNTKKHLLYDDNNPTEVVHSRRQINILILDEANRRNIEDLLVKFQNSLDSDSGEPEHNDFRIALDNAGEKRISPNTFIIMTGNSPREDSGRVVQSRPFKRRHNFLPVENLFRRELANTPTLFIDTTRKLWGKVGPVLRIDATVHDAFEEQISLPENLTLLSHLQEILTVLDKHGIGVSFGLTKKILKTSAMRFALGDTFLKSLDSGLSESVFSLLAGEEPIDGKSLKDSLDDMLISVKSSFPTFFSRVEMILRGADMLGRVRPFL